MLKHVYFSFHGLLCFFLYSFCAALTSSPDVQPTTWLKYVNKHIHGLDCETWIISYCNVNH